jgi:hypothetical protein
MANGCSHQDRWRFPGRGFSCARRCRSRASKARQDARPGPGHVAQVAIDFPGLEDLRIQRLAVLAGKRFQPRFDFVLELLIFG